MGADEPRVLIRTARVPPRRKVRMHETLLNSRTPTDPRVAPDGEVALAARSVSSSAFIREILAKAGLSRVYAAPSPRSVAECAGGPAAVRINSREKTPFESDRQATNKN
jgi:hypothetical protein